MEGHKVVERDRSWQSMEQMISRFGGCPQILHSHPARLQLGHLRNALEVCYSEKHWSVPNNIQMSFPYNFSGFYFLDSLIMQTREFLAIVLNFFWAL